MLFHELVFKDFLVFRGENRLVFPPLDDRPSSLVVVLAPNNGGKTNVIRALRFLLYGITGETEGHAERLINKAAVADAAAGATDLEAWVGATVTVAGKTRTIRRRIEARRYADGRIQQKQILLEETTHARAGDHYQPDQGQVARALESLVPRALFDYFYFQGETLAEKLLRGSGEQPLRAGLATLLHQDKWGEAANSVRLARQSIVKELGKLQEANQEYGRTQEALELARTSLERQKAEAEAAREKMAAADREYRDCEEQIIALSTGTSHTELNTMLKRKRSELDQADADIRRLNQEISKQVARSRGVPFFQAAFAPGLKLLERLREQNIIPAGVSAPFIHRLLHAQVCVCGRELATKENTHERSCVENYLRRTLEANLSSQLLSLLNSLDPRMKANFAEESTALGQDLAKALEDYDQAVARQFHLNAAVKDLETRREQSNYKAIVDWQQKQRTARDQSTQAKEKCRELDVRIAGLQSQVGQLSNELQAMERQSGGGSRMMRLSAARKRSEELLELIDTSLAFLKNSFHRILQTSVSRYYDRAVTDGSVARIDPESLLPSVMRNQSHVTFLGGGQRQLLVLAHIISLAELRRELHTQLDSIKIMTGKLDDQSFFLDSVFAPCDEEYARIVADFLPGKARQMVLLVASQQWHDKIRRGIEPHVDRAFCFQLHSPNPGTNSDDYQVTFRGQPVRLLTKIATDAEAYSTIHEIS